MPLERVVGIHRNRWSASIGIDGRHGPEHAHSSLPNETRSCHTLSERCTRTVPIAVSPHLPIGPTAQPSPFLLYPTPFPKAKNGRDRARSPPHRVPLSPCPLAPPSPPHAPSHRRTTPMVLKITYTSIQNDQWRMWYSTLLPHTAKTTSITSSRQVSSEGCTLPCLPTCLW